MRTLVAVLGAILLAACGGQDEPAARAAAGFAFRADATEIPAGGQIDPRFSCDGDDLSPALAWEGAPAGTVELALLVDDPDADGFTHWIVYGIAPEVATLPEGIPVESSVSGAVSLSQGENEFGDVGWGGPCPPPGDAHRYVFRLLALDAALRLAPEATRDAFDAAVDGHVLATAELEASYRRG